MLLKSEGFSAKASKGEVEQAYYKSLTTRALESSGFADRAKEIAYNRPDPQVHIGLIRAQVPDMVVSQGP